MEAALNTIAARADQHYSTVKRKLIDSRRRLSATVLDQAVFDVLTKLRSENRSGQEDPFESFLRNQISRTVFPITEIRFVNQQMEKAADGLVLASKTLSDTN